MDDVRLRHEPKQSSQVGGIGEARLLPRREPVEMDARPVGEREPGV